MAEHPSIFFYLNNTPFRREAARRMAEEPSADRPDAFALYGADELAAAGYTIHHNLEVGNPSPRCQAWSNRLSAAIRLFGGYGGDFAGLWTSLKRAQSCDCIVSTGDSLGVPLLFMKGLGLIRKPVYYISVGLPERIQSMKCRPMKAFYRRALASCAGVAAYGWGEAEWLKEWMKGREVTFIPFGTHANLFKPDGEKIDTDICSVGADYQRDFTQVLTAARNHPGIRFRLVVSNHWKNQLPDLPQNVQVLTELSLEETKRAMASSRVVVLPVKPNLYSGATTTLLQAMALGKPVVVTAVDAIREGYGLEDKVNVRLAAPEDASSLERAMLELLEDPETARKIGAEARKHVEAELNWIRFTERIRIFLQPGDGGARDEH